MRDARTERGAREVERGFFDCGIGMPFMLKRKLGATQVARRIGQREWSMCRMLLKDGNPPAGGKGRTVYASLSIDSVLLFRVPILARDGWGSQRRTPLEGPVTYQDRGSIEPQPLFR